MTVTPWPRSVMAADAAGGGAGALTVILRSLIVIAVLVGMALLAGRHPLIGRRLLLMVPTMLVVSVIVFTLVQLPPGDFAARVFAAVILPPLLAFAISITSCVSELRDRRPRTFITPG